MRTSTLLYALVGISSGLAINFGDRTLPACSDNCYKDIIGRPGLRDCPRGNDRESLLCLCNDYAIMNAMQDCLSSKNDCGAGRSRVDTIYDLQEVCDEVILAAAQPSAPSSSKPTSSRTPAPVDNRPEPTSLEEAEAMLGASAQAKINEKPFELSTGQKAGIALGSIAGFLVLATIGFCCGVYQYKNYMIKKMNKQIQNSPVPSYPTDLSDKGTGSSWFTNASGFKSRMTGSHDNHELGYGLDKELGLMISAPSNPRKFTTTKIQTVDIPESAHTIPRVPPPAVSPHRNPASPPLTSPVSRTMSLGSVMAAQRPSLSLASPTLVLPQATIEDYTPRNSIRVSVQSVHNRPPQNGPNINIPLMFFTPATPQMNTSPISPSDSNAHGDIYNYYSRDSVPVSDNAIGVARTSIDERTASTPVPYDPTNNDYSRTPSPAYTVNASVSSPYNNYTAPTPEPRHGTPGYDISSDASSRFSASPSPFQAVGAGLHMPPRHTPYSPNNSSFSPTPSASPAPSEASQTQDQAPPVPPKVREMVDLSSMPATISRANSHAWRLSVERAAERAMDKVRTTPSSEFEDVPEEEERLTKSELPNTTDDSRGRRKKRNQSQGSNTYNKGDARSGSIGASRSPSNKRTSNSGYARRSSSLGGYRNRTNSLSYSRVDGVPPPPRRNSRRGSNSSSVMMI